MSTRMYDEERIGELLRALPARALRRGWRPRVRLPATRRAIDQIAALAEVDAELPAGDAPRSRGRAPARRCCSPSPVARRASPPSSVSDAGGRPGGAAGVEPARRAGGERCRSRPGRPGSPASGPGAAPPARACGWRSSTAASRPAIPPSERVQQAVTIGDPDKDEVLVDEEGDLCGHGTACAGIVRSIAPDCELVSVRVLGAGYTGSGPVLMAGPRVGGRATAST